jgi:hypothetical protein
MVLGRLWHNDAFRIVFALVVDPVGAKGVLQ